MGAYDTPANILWQSFAAGMAALYYLFALVTLLQLVRIHRAQAVKKFTIQKVFHIMIIWATCVRATLFAVPTMFYNMILAPKYRLLQMFLDLLPELSFFYIYFLLVLFWGVVFQYSRGLDSRVMLYRNIWVCFFVGGGLVLLADIALMAYVPYFTTYFLTDSEGVFLCALTACLGACAAMYTFYTFRTLKRSAIHTLESGNSQYIPSNSTASGSTETTPQYRRPPPRQLRRPSKKQSMERRVRVVGIITFLCFAVHCGYILLVDLSEFTQYIEPRTAYITIWSAYFLFTELLPNVLLLWALSRIAPPSMQSPVSRDSTSAETQAQSLDHPLYASLYIPRAGPVQPYDVASSPLIVGGHQPYAVTDSDREPTDSSVFPSSYGRLVGYSL